MKTGEQTDSVFFWQERHYRSSDGRAITEYEPHGEPPAEFPRFIGHGIAQAPIPDGTGRMAEADFSFPIEADTINEAMQAYPEQHERHRMQTAKKLQADIEKQMGPKIAVAGSVPKRVNGRKL